MELWVFDHSAFDLHRAPFLHPEAPERLAAARRAIERLPFHVFRGQVPLASSDVLSAVHSESHWRMIASLPDEFGHLDPDTFYSPGSREAALRAGGACAEMGTLLARNEAMAIALVRPPGHHAERCLLYTS
ncbi:MAG: histone deacetylase, partial [Deltaproteobacteria bacterium]|nr:histone deacetylase [Deltaproteobacteria bacterium]